MHTFFDMNMGFTRREKCVAVGHRTYLPLSIVYEYVLSRGNLNVSFIFAELNYIGILSAFIQGLYLNTPYNEELWFQTRVEFGSRKG